MALENFANYLLENEMIDEEDYVEGDALNEASIIKVDAAGTKTKRKKAPQGFKVVDGKLAKISSIEKVNRSKSAKRAARKRKTKQGQINRKTAKAMGKRKAILGDK